MVRLPSETEWESAARGLNGNRWPWGDADPERWQINADPAHLRRTSPVGVFAQADTPDGPTDLAGNVWEWTNSLYTIRLDEAGFNTEAPEGLARRVVRGGSWDSSIVFCRASFRNWFSPDGRYNLSGFRLVASGPISGTEP
jgi:formylglycine-generating enzyme required for sulfatase activity